VARLLVLDRGNHSLKIALFDGSRIVGRWRDEGSRPADALRAVADDLAREAAGAAGARMPRRDRRRLVRTIGESILFHSAAVSSVDARATDQILRSLERLGASRVLTVSSRIELPFALRVERPATVGPDRLAAAAGVVASGTREGIIVDAGTAITVDVLSRRGFLGGAIFPGSGLLLRALHDGTAALPLLRDASGAAAPPGGSTEQAIRAGVHWGSAGAVKELVARSRRALSGDSRVWVTGGGGASLARHLGPGTRYARDLVFLGLRLLFDLNAS
jgi:type III pantothenate kinase